MFRVSRKLKSLLWPGKKHTPSPTGRKTTMDSEKPLQNHQKQQMQEYDALSKIAHLLFVGPLRSFFQLAKRGVHEIWTP